jgi:hypothetical protein
MILSSHQFSALWSEFFSKFLPYQNLYTLYRTYCTRENHLEDYLDIFRGEDTRQRRNQNIETPHPFAGILHNGYSVRYILIAEAAPPGTNYIYKDASGEYIKAALKAFEVQNLDILKTPQKLEALAQNGILILDLFPFNLDYNLLIAGAGIRLREILIDKNITLDFLVNTDVIYSIINRVNTLRCQINNFLNHNYINTAFMATPIINNYLGALNFSSFLDFSSSPIKIQNGLNSFNHHVSINHARKRYEWQPDPQIEIINSFGTNYNVGALRTSPFFSSSCNNGSGSPHEILIKNALNL